MLPNRLSRRRQSGVGQRKSERLGHDLSGSGGAKELASAARRAACLAPKFLSQFQAQLPVREASSDGLHPARILGPARRQGHASRHEHAGQTLH